MDVPATAKHALSVWADALGIDWPKTHALTSAATVEHNEEAKQAPATLELPK